MVYKKPEDLTPFANNPRVNDNSVPYLMNSIHDYGFQIPITLDVNGVIIAGHTRLKAAKGLIESGDCGLWGYPPKGMSPDDPQYSRYQCLAPLIPCSVASNLDQDDADRFRLVDNKTNETSYWDMDKAESEMTRLGGAWENYGFEPLVMPADLPVWDGPETVVDDSADDGIEASATEYSAREGGYRLLATLPEGMEPSVIIGMLEDEGCRVKILD